MQRRTHLWEYIFIMTIELYKYIQSIQDISISYLPPPCPCPRPYLAGGLLQTVSLMIVTGFPQWMMTSDFLWEMLVRIGSMLYAGHQKYKIVFNLAHSLFVLWYYGSALMLCRKECLRLSLSFSIVPAEGKVWKPIILWDLGDNTLIKEV